MEEPHSESEIDKQDKPYFCHKYNTRLEASQRMKLLLGKK